MILRVFEDKPSLGQEAAAQAATTIRAAIASRGLANIVAAAAASPYLIVQLDEACRNQQVGEGWFPTLADVPKQAISMSVRQILKAGEIVCVAPDARKAQAVKDCFGGETSPMAPASILRTHPNTTVFLDTHSASMLNPSLIAACATAQ